LSQKRLKSTVSIRHPGWRNLAATWAHFRATSAQVGSSCGFERDIGPIRNPQNVRFHQYFQLIFDFDDALFEATFPMLCFRCAQLGVKLSPKVPSSGMLELTWISMYITWLQYGVHLAFGAQFQPNFGGSPGQTSWAQPSPSQFCGLNATR
jgi:hypothetical protein